MRIRERGIIMSGKKNKKTVFVVSVIAACFVVVAIFAGIMLTSDTNAKGDPETKDLKANEVEIVNEDGEVEVVEKDSKEAKEYKDAVTSGERESVTETKKSGNTSTSSSNKNNSSSSKNNSSTSNSSNSSSSSNKNNNSSSGGTSKPTTHTHTWTAVYATKQVQVGTEYKCVGSVEVCNCGARNIDYAHTKAHALAGEPSNSSVEEIWEDVPIYETKKYVNYYKCSCGATK